MYISIYLRSIEERWKLVREKEYEALYIFFIYTNFQKFL